MCIRDRHWPLPIVPFSPLPAATCPRALRLVNPVSYTHLRAHETPEHLVCRLLLEKRSDQERLCPCVGTLILVEHRKIVYFFFFFNDTATTEIYTRSLVGSVRCV